MIVVKKNEHSATRPPMDSTLRLAMHSHNVLHHPSKLSQSMELGLQEISLLADLPLPFSLISCEQPSYCIISPEHQISNQVRKSCFSK